MMPPEPDLIDTQRSAIIDGARAIGLDPQTAAQLAQEVEQRVRQRHGGNTCYLAAPSKSERNRQLRDAYRRGINVAVLAVQYTLSESRVRQIVAGGPE